MSRRAPANEVLEMWRRAISTTAEGETPPSRVALAPHHGRQVQGLEQEHLAEAPGVHLDRGPRVDGPVQLLDTVLALT
jgi:hypothetical protein